MSMPTGPTRRGLLGAAALAGLAACRHVALPGPGAPSGPPSQSPASGSTSPAVGIPASSPSASPAPASPRLLAARATLPVLCWHQLRDWRPDDGGYARRYLICPPARFRAQLDALREAGRTTVSPDQYLDHLEHGTPLPPRPVLLSFDDSQATQVTEGLPQLRRRGMTATFFAMTVVLGKRDWMSPDDLRRLHAAGMTVAAHTWDHHRADRYGPADWKVQLDQPRELLERIVRAPVEHFAYPYGAWAPADFPHLRSAGYRTAFQLSDRPLDAATPLLTLRRILVESTWTGPALLAAMAP